METAISLVLAIIATIVFMYFVFKHTKKENDRNRERDLGQERIGREEADG